MNIWKYRTQVHNKVTKKFIKTVQNTNILNYDFDIFYIYLFFAKNLNYFLVLLINLFIQYIKRKTFFYFRTKKF